MKDNWSEAQLSAAKDWGGGPTPLELAELGFPGVDPDLDTVGVAGLASQTLEALVAKGAKDGDPVHLTGKPILVHSLVLGLKARGLVPLASTTLRESTETLGPDGTVVTKREFRFRQFRAY
jgi:hypothetical protein